MKEKSTLLLMLVVLGFVAWYFIDTHQTQVRERHAAEIRQQQRSESIAALALKYNAVTNWQAGLPNQGMGDQLSVDISRALTGNNHQPILFLCILDDIVEQDGKTIAKLIPLDAPVIDNLTLQCSLEQAKIFTGTGQNPTFAVVARCHEVQRKSENDESFSVKGELTDVVQLP